MPRKYIKKGGHGGARLGAGRKPAGDGIAQRYRERFKFLPVDYFMEMVNGKDPTTGETPSAKRRDAAAKNAAPYIHRRPAPVRVDGNHQPSQPSVIDLEKLDDEELRQLEIILAKAG